MLHMSVEVTLILDDSITSGSSSLSLIVFFCGSVVRGSETRMFRSSSLVVRGLRLRCSDWVLVEFICIHLIHRHYY